MTAVPVRNPIEITRRCVLPLLAALLLAPGVRAQSEPLEDLDNFPRGQLEIALNRKQSLTFEVWLADTPPRQQQGLMFVRSLPPMRGMLFVWQSPKQLGMWMKNTYIPLDMIFIDERGHIQNIAERTTPHSRQTVHSLGMAIAVLEIAGGEARRLGLRPGQRVRHPALPNH
jgi:uncharacterized membrane protein (UPF0127 family)